MRPTLRRTAAVVFLLPPLVLALAAPVAAEDGAPRGGPPGAYLLSGDPGGSQFEGIDVVDKRRTFYVTETTGGEVHRGRLDRPETEVWLDEDAALADGRRTAVGIATDRRERVFVAGGDNRTQEGAPADAPDLWVYDDDRHLLAALRMPVDGPLFLNDVVVGPDGAAYVTDSTTPRVFRVAREHGGWTATLWSDATAAIPQEPGTFGLNGIEVAPDRRSLVVAHSAAGQLWRFDLATAAPTLVDTADADLASADGLVVEGRTLVAVRNFPRLLTYLRLDRHATAAQVVTEVATDPERVLTTADVARGKLLLVDSQFDEEPPSQDSEVVVLPFRP
ncbi:gluconolaconase [Blastococcus sp. MG754426]|uniref:SMP-30/gluconolactonase/LRE family protein n=1 Tax=unclassified Blastococcus TaxID=2619396 RepID=UPI001EF0B6BF|nr:MULTISPECIES: SMP-30/gluconolactonase/LRE family protein [unclassified Blastococcus]MCF6509963.1 gluconolaconase [Blastococcus sp. MG754426]MCF6514047.1 gluconolaconase [Blastococcus sp. MG754427]MCF6737144.1 gluconolaconase [Blastococcus sp. KM273129]